MRIVILLFSLLLPLSALAIEQPEYTVVEKDGDIEIRSYPELVVARTRVSGSFKEVGNKAFRRLGGYIFGDNDVEKKIAMTAPVTQAPAEEGGYWVTFFMPSEYSIESLPTPVDASVERVKLEAATFAVLRYRGGWGEARYQEHVDRLKTWLAAQDSWAAGEEVTWARYNSPFTLPFMRSNEVMIPVWPASQTR